MTKNLRFHIANPENNSSTGFTEFNTVDFVINADGRKLLKNSIRIEGDVNVKIGGADIDVSKDIKIDNRIGAHAFFDSWNITMPQTRGLIANLQEYPRYVKAVATCNYSKDDYYSAELLAEMRGGSEINGEYNIQRQTSYNVGGDADLQDPNFSIAPVFPLNNMEGGNYSFAKNGQIRVSCNLSKNADAVYGKDCIAAAQASYTITNLRLRYMTIPDDGRDNAIIMRSYVKIKNTIQSNSANIAVRVPSNAVSGVHISFLEQSSLTDPSKNKQALNVYPNFLELNYSFADAVGIVSYTITDIGDAQLKGVDAVQNSVDNSDGVGNYAVDMQNYKANNGYILGLDFQNALVDLTKDKFSFNIKSNSSSAVPNQLVYLYFHTLLNL